MNRSYNEKKTKQRGSFKNYVEHNLEIKSQEILFLMKDCNNWVNL